MLSPFSPNVTFLYLRKTFFHRFWKTSKDASEIILASLGLHTTRQQPVCLLQTTQTLLILTQIKSFQRYNISPTLFYGAIKPKYNRFLRCFIWCLPKCSKYNDHLGQSIQDWTKYNLWKTVFKKIEGIWSAEADHSPSIFLKAVFHKFYLVHSWTLCPIYTNLIPISHTNHITENNISSNVLLKFVDVTFQKVFWEVR